MDVLCITKEYKDNYGFADMPLHKLRKLKGFSMDRNYWYYLRKKQKEERARQTEELLKIRQTHREYLRSHKNNYATAQGDFVEKEGLGEDTTKLPEDENTTGISTNIVYDILKAPTSGSGVQSTVLVSTDLEEFFNRKVLIADFTLSALSSLNEVINVWDAWSDDNTIRAKLSNYSYFSASHMEIEIVVASTKYHFGHILVSYQPFQLLPSGDIYHWLTKMLDYEASPDSQWTEVINCYLSQSPECGILKMPSDNSLCMELPLLTNRNMISLMETNLLVSGSSYEEFVNLGHGLYLRSLEDLQVANDDSTQDVTISVYASVHNVKLGLPTATDINITAEGDFKRRGRNKKGKFARNSNNIVSQISGVAKQFVDDEYSNAGPVTTIASAISNIASNFKNIPVIGGLATATSYAGSTVAKIANLFGFSRPVNIDPFILMKRFSFANSSLYSTKDTVQKLTGDPKQELGLYFGTTDSVNDPMAINAITSRETFLFRFVWFPGAERLVDNLAVIPIHPNIDLTEGSFTTPSGLTIIHQPTALSSMAKLFTYWRGTITFHFEVVCSDFHRGKLLFIYEPNVDGGVLINSKPTRLNQQKTYVLDIQESKSITINCTFNCKRTFARTCEFEEAAGVGFTENSLAQLSASNNISDCLSGLLFVRVLDKIVGPSQVSGNFANIHCFVSSDDIEFAVPRTNFGTISREAIQAEGEYTLGDSLNNDNIYLMNFGEQITSLRSLLKRSFLGCEFFHNTTTTLGYFNYRLPLYPPQSVDFMSLPLSPNVVGGTPNIFNYLRSAFTGMRGGMRLRVVPNIPHHASVVTVVQQTIATQQKAAASSVGANMSTDAYIGTQGNLLFGNEGIEYEIPYSCNDNFLPCHCFDTGFGSHSNFTLPTSHVKILTDTGVTMGTVFVFYSIAEDFTFFRFQGMPPLEYTFLGFDDLTNRAGFSTYTEA